MLNYFYSFIDRTPLSFFIIFSLLLGLAPFFPEPHLFEKTKMLFSGTLAKPIDIFDLFYHLLPFVLLGIKLTRV